MILILFQAKNGIPSITFDWRGCHSNLKEHLSQCTATLTDWGTKVYIYFLFFILYFRITI